MNKDKGDILILEDEAGLSVNFFEKSLKDLMNQTKQNNQEPECVFVSSCQSECVGRVFSNAGAKHVICIRKEDKVQDAAAIQFSKTFYYCIFNQKMSVCQAFEQAKLKVRDNFKDREAFKFLLFKSSSHPKECWGFDNFLPGKLTDMTTPPIFKQIPAPVNNFLGRDAQLYLINLALQKNRFVSIIGP